MVTVDEFEYAKDVTVANVYGLHARPAAEFVKLASKYASEILVDKDGLEVNGKSIMGVMMLAASQGTVLTLRISGEDEEEAARQLTDLVNDYFGEGQ